MADETQQTDENLTGPENEESGVGKTGEDLPSPPQAQEGTVPPDNGVTTERDHIEVVADSPADYEQLGDPRKDHRDLPPGVAVGGSMVRHRDDVPSDEGKPSADQRKGPGTVHAQPVRVDGRNVRSDDDALEGHAVKVIAGEHEGQTAHFVNATAHDEKTGYPTHALIRFADTRYHTHVTVVPYEHLRPANKYIG